MKKDYHPHSLASTTIRAGGGLVGGLILLLCTSTQFAADTLIPSSHRISVDHLFMLLVTFPAIDKILHHIKLSSSFRCHSSGQLLGNVVPPYQHSVFHMESSSIWLVPEVQFSSRLWSWILIMVLVVLMKITSVAS